MKIDKVMNNNVVSSIDEDGQEIIVVGTGIGFQASNLYIISRNKNLSMVFDNKSCIHFDNKSCIQRSVLDKRTLLAYHLIILKNFETQKGCGPL